MLATLIPLFDETMAVKAYSLFAQKKNYLLTPSLLGTGSNDGAADIVGLDLIESMGIETLSADKEVFVEVNNISIFADINSQTKAPHERLVLLANHTVTAEEIYVKRLKELKQMGYRLAIRKLADESFESYHDVLALMDYILLDNKKNDMQKAKAYFKKSYPKMKLCAVNVESLGEYDALKDEGGFDLFEGGFFRVPVTQGEAEVAPLKVNYIELLNLVNDSDFDLSKAADVIGRDTALVISLLGIVNRLSLNSEITSIRHAAAMLGQRELKKWINTAVTNELCADKPNEITRLSLLRAKFAENLAPIFEMAVFSSELFLMGLFSVLDLILDRPMEEALQMVKVSKHIEDALINHKGELAPVLDFIIHYENASWQEVSRQMVLKNIDMDHVYDAYTKSLQWYRDLFGNK
ncbi:MAG: HDOD domain-containing protein [Ruminococcus sp.]|nr:HDOD domain-containing protein [Ruminococcus sp.]MCM1155699.1 HDOD domain-containing protein [Roseburia sp.]